MNKLKIVRHDGTEEIVERIVFNTILGRSMLAGLKRASDKPAYVCCEEIKEIVCASDEVSFDVVEKTHSIEFYSNTYEGEDILFCIYAAVAKNEGDSEEIVCPLLNSHHWCVVSEDTYQYKTRNLSSHGAFENAKRELIALGFEYKGPIDSDAKN